MPDDFTEAHDKRLMELYDLKGSEKVPNWDAVVIIMNTEFFERVPRFTKHGLKSRRQRLLTKRKRETAIEDMPPATHPFARWDG
jgi:hypothetical protein